MSEEELKSRLLMGLDIDIGSITIKNYTIGEIFKYGLDKYRHLVSLVVITPKDILNDLSVSDAKEINMYDLMCTFEPLREWFVDMMYFLTGHTFEYNEVFYEFITYKNNERVTFGGDDVKYIFDIVKKMYCLGGNKEEIKPVNDEVAKAFAEFEEWEKEIEEKSGNKITINSIVCGLNTNVNCKYGFFDIFNLTMYQLMATYYGVEQNSNHSFVMSAIYAGTIKSDSAKESNWAKEIKI